MDPLTLVDYLGGELRKCGHPDIVEVLDLDGPGVGVRCDDGVSVYAKVAWLGRADQRPDRPQWPSREDLQRGGRR